jgi:glycosyltransferase involved in cell wall biosynthesis
MRRIRRCVVENSCGNWRPSLLLSIVICNYNYARFLDSAIASAVDQTYANKEVIVVDDGSTDGSPEIIRRWNGKITAVFQRNEGQIAAYNRGFSEARGDVIMFVDSDDMLDPGAGERIIAAFADRHVSKVHFRLRLIDAAGEALGPNIPRRLSDGDVSGYLRLGTFYYSSPGSGNAYRRETLARLMPLPAAAEDTHGADFFAIQGAALLGTVRAVGPAPLGSYRVHVEHASKQILLGNAWLKDPVRAQKRYDRLRRWLVERLGADYVLPSEFADFSINKQVFAELVFGSAAYTDGLQRGAQYLRSKLVRSIWGRPSPLGERAGLTAWALAVLLLPREIGRPVARYVCNPASRNLGSYFRSSHTVEAAPAAK